MSEITIFVSGDFCPDRDGKLAFKDGVSPQNVFGEFYNRILKTDMAITNLEGPLTTKNNPIKKIGDNFKINPHASSLLKDAGFDLVTLANNHIYDQGQQGLNDTFKILNENGIKWVGAGKTIKEAKKPFYFDIKNQALAILNFTEVEFTCADQNHGGANPLDLIENVRQINKAKEKADKVIVIIHGGHEHHKYPSPETQKRYRFFAENGADIILAHHPHCIGGYEIHEGVPIFYSLGNFLFPPRNKKTESWFKGYAVMLNIEKNELNFEILPYEQCKNGNLSIKTKFKNSSIHREIEEISKKLKNEDIVNSKWKEYVEKKKRFLAIMSGYNKYASTALSKMGLMDYFLNENKLQYNKQFITCQAHRETARTLLEKFLKY